MTSINHDNDLCFVIPPSPSASADPDKLHSKLEALEKVEELCENYTNLNNASNDPKNLLDNLCDGLQTFLGYDKDSKGYNGQGIVYSDLDRLCDAVMAFLSGVLSAVKDDPSVTTYYAKMNDTLKKIKDSMHKPNGLSTAVEAVSEALGEWDKNLTNKIDDVKHYFNNLNADKLTQFNNSLNALNTCEPSEVAARLGECIDRAKGISDAFDWAEGAYNQLDKSLKDKLKDPVNNIKVQVKSFVEAAKNEELKKVVETAASELKTLETQVIAHATHCVTKMRENIDEQMVTLLKNINTANNKLKQWLAAMGEWIKETKTFIAELLQKRADEILYEVNEGAETCKRKQVAQAIQVNELNLEGAVEDLERWKREASEVVKKGLWRCHDILDRTSIDQSQISMKAKELQDKAVELRTAANTAIKNVKQHVSQALQAVNEMNDKLKEDLGNIKRQLKGALLSYVKGGMAEKIRKKSEEETDKIARREESTTSADGNLDKIVKGFQTYAESFTGKLNENIKKMVDTIVDSEGVKQLLDWYVGENNARFQGTQRGNDVTIKSRINVLIGEQVAKLIKSQLSSTKGDAHMVLRNIQQYLKAVAENVNPKHYTDGIIDAIESDPELGVDKSYKPQYKTHRKHYLEKAFKSVLAAISQTVAEIGTEMENLISASNVGELKPAISGVQGLGQKLQDALSKTAGSKGPRTFGDEVLEEIHQKLNQQIGDEDTVGAPVLLGSGKLRLDKLGNYKLHVIQTSEIQEALKSGNLKGTEGDPGTLPTKINNIQKEGLTKLATGDITKIVDPNTKLFENAFDDIKLQLGQIIKYVTEKQDGRKYFDGSQDMKKGVHTLLTELKNGLTEGVESVFTKGLEEIKNNVEKFKSGHILDVLEKLNSLCDAVKNSSEFLTGNLGTLKNDVFDRKLKNLMHDLRELQQTKLAPLIDEAQRIRNSIISQCKQCIWDIEMFVSQEVNRSTKAIQNEARKQYHAKISNVFEKLKAIVHYKTEEIKIVIDKDKKTGVKGFLRTIYGIKVTVITFALPDFGQSATLLAPLKEAFTIAKFKDLSSKFHAYVTNILPYIEDEIKIPPQPRSAAAIVSETDESRNVKKINEDLKKLLTNLIDAKQSKKYNYDHQFTKLLSHLSSSLASLRPSHFANPRHPELLDAVRAGLQGFVKEMGRVYVNGYDGKTIKWIENEDGEPKITVQGKNCAKAFFSFLPMLLEDMSELTAICRSNLSKKINKYDQHAFGNWFNKRGYRINTEKGKQTGELQDSGSMMGRKIYDEILNWNFGNFNEKLTTTSWISLINEHKKRKNSTNHNIHLVDILEYLYDCLNRYNDVCHLSTLTSKRYPCSVYEMLLWLSGLPHNPVHQGKLSLTIMQILQALYKKGREHEEEHGDVLAIEQQADGVDFKVSLIDTRSVSLEAYPRDVSYAELLDAVTHICSTSYDILCTIAGHGDELTTYASDYSNNIMKFYYPALGEDCFEMMLDIFRRLLPSLRFMYTQCGVSSKHHGWQNCKYGKDIRTGKWPCKEHPNEQPNDEPNDESRCQPNSPLMSYLNDCLPGHLPHQLTKIGCKYECANCPSVSKKGMPCLTPLGFRGFSNSPKTGKAICEVLTKFFSNELTWSLFCLSPKPPMTLPEHFVFALSLVNDWVDTSRMKKRVTNRANFQSSFESIVDSMSIKLHDAPAELSNALTSAYGSQSVVHGTCENPHLANLTSSTICKNGRRNVGCAPYLSVSSNDTYTYLAYKNCDVYLSWAVYLPWELWRLLDNLYKAFTGIVCQDWGCRSCMKGDTCRTGQHGLNDEKTSIPNCRCYSIVSCKGVASTLYTYGFAFGNAAELNGMEFEKTCSDFCNLLNRILNSKYFDNLFTKCDNFQWKIRAPFVWTTLALWLLSLLYLIHIMVIRLDLLHLKSHLHSPSSHRIAAQSLLAAGRVNKLGRVFYLQP